MKISEKIVFPLFLLSGCLIVAGTRYDIAWLSSMGIALVGLIPVVGGIRIIIRGKTFLGKTRISNPRYIERYSGISARLMGAVLLLSGLIIILLSTIDVFYAGGAKAFLESLINSRYGIALVLGLAGVLVMTFGIVRTMTGSATSPGTHAKYVEVSIRLGGAIAAMIGIGMCILAVGTIVKPFLIKELISNVGRFIRELLLNQ